MFDLQSPLISDTQWRKFSAIYDLFLQIFAHDMWFLTKFLFRKSESEFSFFREKATAALFIYFILLRTRAHATGGGYLTSYDAGFFKELFEKLFFLQIFI